jgi:tetratricopeptide (TPR) repeat protein
MADNARKRSRIITAAIIVVYATWHVVVQYYANLDSRFRVSSPHGLMALADYEMGRYAGASKEWRLQYGLAYDRPEAERSEQLLTERVAKEPGKLETYYALGDRLFCRGDYAGAAAVYRAALGQRPDDYDAKVGLAASLCMSGDYKQADTVFAGMLRQSYQQKTMVSFLNTLVALDKLENTKSTEESERYLTLAFVNRYLRIIDARREKEVISYADRALALNGRLDNAYMCKGMMYLKQNQYQQAIDQFTKAVKVNHLNADAYNRLGVAYGKLGDVEEELASYRTAVEVQPGDSLSAFRLGELLQQKYGDLRQAGVYFQKAHQADPSDYQSISSYGFTLMQLREYDKALAVCAAMKQKFPDRPYNFVLQADCLLAMKKYREAIDCYQKAQEEGRRTGEQSMDFHAFSELGSAYAKLSQWEPGIAAYRQALSIKPYDVNTLFNLQFLYRMQGNHNQAYAAVKEILRLQPNHEAARRLLPYLKHNAGLGKVL